MGASTKVRILLLLGTIVVVVASALATVYVGLLDQLWTFVTKQIYGA